MEAVAVGWTIDAIEPGTGELKAIFHLSKGEGKSKAHRRLKIYANYAGCWTE